MDKHTIIKLKREGHSNRKVAKLTGIDRKTIARYWNEHKELIIKLESGSDPKEIQEAIVSAPKYDVSKRKPHKYNDEIDKFLDDIIASEENKCEELGIRHKQKLTNVQIHELVREAGHDIGLSMISVYLKEKRDKKKEVFIRQEYGYGERLEYDFGEVRLVLGGKTHILYIAVVSSPGSGFRWAYLYRSQKKEVFMDSHVRFFEMAGGIYKEIVYDNMRNVVSKFIGRNEKQLNEDLVKMSMYYGFNINVTNCFKGNEKGHVEGSVKVVRNKAFAAKYHFDSFKEAEIHLDSTLRKMNQHSSFEEEMKHLMPYRPPLELAQITEQGVDKYSFIRVDNNFYSVPEYLVGRKVLVKNYLSYIMVYSSGNMVCSHQKKTGFHETSVDIYHYLDTFKRKPGAIKNSTALKSNTDLKSLYDNHFAERPRDFITILHENKGKSLLELQAAIEAVVSGATAIATSTGMEENVMAMAKRQVSELSRLFMEEGSGAYIH